MVKHVLIHPILCEFIAFCCIKCHKVQPDPLHCKARRVAKCSGKHKAMVAVANQMARISWSVLAKGVVYDPLRGGAVEASQNGQRKPNTYRVARC